MPIVEPSKSTISSQEIISRNESTIGSEIPNNFKNTKTHSSTFDQDEHMRRKSEMNDLPLSFASFYYSLKVLKGKGL